jgi:hypothetical protein
MGELDLEAFVPDFRRKTVILDANLLVLSLTASTDQSMLKTFKRVGAFTFEDALLLEWLLTQFAGIVTTAYVLAEASNLGNALSGANRDAWFAKLAQYSILTMEAHIPTKSLGDCPETIRFGITDSALTQLSVNFVLLTAEHRISGYLQSINKQVLNFNNLRPYWMLR